MTENELTIPDVLADKQKNFCNIYLDSAEDSEAENLLLNDSLYYTETDFVDFISSRKFSNRQNLTIISLNIANLLAKLRSFKLFINNITTSYNSPDIIIVVLASSTRTQPRAAAAHTMSLVVRRSTTEPTPCMCAHALTCTPCPLLA